MNVLRIGVRLARFAWALLGANRPRLVVLVVGSLAAALAGSAMSLGSVTSLATVNETLQAGWRGSYDILVRPSGATDITIGDHDLVPANYLGNRSATGITRDQWAAIRSIPGVEVAAPVAALGWMRQSDVAVGVVLPDMARDQIARVELTTEIGGRTATAATAYVAIDPETQQPVLLVGATDVVIGPNQVEITLGTLPSTWGEVVGVDPEEESRLVGLDQYVTEGDYLGAGVGEVTDQQFRANALALPVLTAQSTPVPGSAKVSVRVISGVDPSLAAKAAADAEGSSLEAAVAAIDDLTAAAPATETEAGAPLSALITPFRPESVIARDGILGKSKEGGGFSAYGRNVILVPDGSPYTVAGGGIVLDRRGTWATTLAPQIAAAQPQTFRRNEVSFGADDTIYRPLRVEKPPLFQLQPIGTYDLGALSDRYNLAANYAPLGIYSDAPRQLRASDGSLQVLPTSLNPGGVNPSPPSAITNLEAVEAIRGANFIDAIRVRVGGIAGYSPEAIRRIEDVAGAIVERTGLQVAVVAGSSPEDVDVSVPGVGTIVERWTSTGEAPRIASGAAGVSGWLLWGAIAVVALYLLTFGLFLVADQRRELGVLRQLGWRRAPVIGVVAAEALVIGCFSAVVALVATLVLGLVLGVVASWGMLLVLVVAISGAHLLAAGLAGLFLLRGALDVRGPSVAGSPGLRASTVLSLGITQALESRARFVGMVLALGGAVALSGLTIAIEAGFSGSLHATVLGQVIAVRIGPYHLLAAAGAVFAAGAILIDAGVLSVERRLAFIGLLRSVGWRARTVRRLIALEVLLPALLAAVIAVALLAIGMIVIGTSVAIMGVVIGAAIVLSAAIGTLSSMPASDLASRVEPSTTLRAEGSTGSVPGFSQRSSILTAGTLGSLAVVGAITWAVIQPPAIPATAFVPPPSPSPTPASAIRIAEDIQAITALPNRRIGSQALQDAQDYVRAELQASGYTVRNLTFVSRSPQFASSAGRAIDREQELSSLFPTSLAYDPAQVARQGLGSQDITFLDATDGPISSNECPPGIVLLRIGTTITDVRLAQDASTFETRCLGQTAGVLALTAPDADWARARQEIGRVALPLVSHVLADSPGLAADADAPWIVAPLDSEGPGATQSAAPTALALEVAREVAAQHGRVHLAFAVTQDGGLASVLTRELVAVHASRVVVLGALGGPLRTALGTAAFPEPPDSAGLTSDLLAATAIDPAAAAWLTVAEGATAVPTGPADLADLAKAIDITPSTSADENVYCLSVGVSAASVSEESISSGSIGSIAGTPADKAEQVHVGELAALASRLTAAVRGGYE